MRHQIWSAAAIGTLSLLTARADIVVLTAVKDNTVYQPFTGSTTNSNGKGEHIFAGSTSDGYLRRALMSFDMTSIP